MSPQDMDPMVKALSGTGLAAFMLVLLRKMWRGVSNEIVATNTDSAQVEVLQNLRAELTRMAEDITQARAAHTEEINELRLSNNLRMNDLENQVDGLEFAMTGMKKAAMEAYVALSEETNMSAASKAAIAGYLRVIMQTTIPKPFNKGGQDRRRPKGVDTSPSPLTESPK